MTKKAFLSLDTISLKNEQTLDVIKSGYTVFDKFLGGFNLGQVSLISGTNASGKSTMLGQFALNCVEQGNGCLMFSGELTSRNVKKWIYTQCAGKDRIIQQEDKHGFILEGKYTVDEYTERQIDEWIGDKFLLYDNFNGYEGDKLGNEIYKQLTETTDKYKLVIIDNLMILDIKKYSNDKYEAQKIFMLKMVKFAKQFNIHVLFVCHPTKVKDFLRKEDISGSSDMMNAADNIFIIHRNTNDFKKRTKEFFGWGENHENYQYDNLIEIAKNRDGGIVDKFFGLYFEESTKRLLNFVNEKKTYPFGKIEQMKIENGGVK